MIAAHIPQASINNISTTYGYIGYIISKISPVALSSMAKLRRELQHKHMAMMFYATNIHYYDLFGMSFSKDRCQLTYNFGGFKISLLY
jgi:hypothetical protein